MPKMKTHHWAGVTLSLKNLFGTLPGRVYGWPKNILHWQGIERSILDIAGAVRPRYAIVDGIVGMEGNGPISGDPGRGRRARVRRRPRGHRRGDRPMMGFDPERIDYLAEAGRFLGQLNPELIDQRGEPPERLTRSFEPPPAGCGHHRRLRLRSRPPSVPTIPS